MPAKNNTKRKIQDWWATNPMTYGSDHGETSYLVGQERQSFELGSRDFFEQADNVLLKWNRSLHRADRAFGKIFDYSRFAGQRVLEIGCGMGFMAMNWAKQGADIVATDLNPVAVAQTKQRFSLFDVQGDVVQTDAENLPFEAQSFSYVYSWGVLHHTPGIENAIRRIYRLLQPGGGIGLMLYNRSSLRARYLLDYVEKYVHMENSFLTDLELHSRYGDGAAAEGNNYTWPVTQSEVKQVLLRSFTNLRIKVLGSEMGSLLDTITPGLGTYLMPMAMKKALARRWGWSLWISAEKPR